jgi:hypothetical protein
LKNQNDLIVAGAVILVCIGVSLAFFFQRREPLPPTPPTPVVVTDAQPVPAAIQYSNNLPGGGGTQGGQQAGGAMPGPAGAGGGGLDRPSVMGAGGG